MLATPAAARSCAGSASGRAGGAGRACFRPGVAGRRPTPLPRLGDGDDNEAGAHAVSGAPYHGGGKSERRQGGAVDRAEHDEREAERTHAAGTGWVAADDGNPHRVVKAPGKHEADQRSAAVAGRERQRLRPLVRREQPPPSVRLERLGDKKEQARRHEQTGVTVRKRPGRRCEVPSGQERKRDHNRAGPESERPPTGPRTMQTQQVLDRETKPARERDRRGGDRFPQRCLARE